MTKNKQLNAGRAIPSNGNLELIDAFRELGQSIGHNLYRIIVFDDGRLEVEFEFQNPWECLVVRLEDWNKIGDLWRQTPEVSNLLEGAVIRKKCTKCFLHERKADSIKMSL
jgi:hypothetical protein